MLSYLLWGPPPSNFRSHYEFGSGCELCWVAARQARGLSAEARHARGQSTAARHAEGILLYTNYAAFLKFFFRCCVRFTVLYIRRFVRFTVLYIRHFVLFTVLFSPFCSICRFLFSPLCFLLFLYPLLLIVIIILNMFGFNNNIKHVWFQPQLGSQANLPLDNSKTHINW